MSRDRVRMVRGLSDRIQESVGGLQEIYANDTTAYESGRFRHQLQRIFRVRLTIYNLKYLIKWINNFLEKFGQFALLLVGGWLIIHHPDTFNLGTLVAFLQAYGQLNEPWRELINYFQQKENARIKYEHVIANSMTGTFEYEKGDRRPVPDFNVFFRYFATYPYYSDAVWYLTQMRRWGQIPEGKPDTWYAETAKKVYLPEVYLAAARLLVKEGLANEKDFPWDSDGYRGPQDDFLDGVAFDGREPNAYLERLAIGLKGNERVVDGAVSLAD